MPKKWNKKYIAECLRKEYPGAIGVEIAFTEITLVGTGETYLRVKYKKRGEERIRSAYLYEMDAHYDVDSLYRRNIVYNAYNGRAW